MRWDSLGEFLALGASLEHLANTSGNKNANVLASTLDKAISSYLKNDNSPRKKVGENDNRGSHFYLAFYWANELANSELGANFKALAQFLNENKDQIIAQLNASQGTSVDLGGYYKLNDEKTTNIMRSSKIFNEALSK